MLPPYTFLLMGSQCSNRKQQQCYISQLNKTGKNKNSNWIADVSGNNCPSQLCLQVAWHSAILAWHISSTENDLGPPKHSAKKHGQQQHLLMSWESKLAVDLLRLRERCILYLIHRCSRNQNLSWVYFSLWRRGKQVQTDISYLTDGKYIW